MSANYIDQRVGKYILRTFHGTKHQRAWLRHYIAGEINKPLNTIYFECNYEGTADPHNLRDDIPAPSRKRLPKGLLKVADKHCKLWAAQQPGRTKQSGLFGRKRQR